MTAAWFIVGATATGKSAVAQLLAEQMGGAVLSCDSMLVYRGMDIGTAKPSPRERGAVVYHGLDLAAPDEPFSTGLWLETARRAVLEQASAGRPLIAAGGTGLYVKALIAGLGGAPARHEARARARSLLVQGGAEALRRELEERAPAKLADLPDPENPRRLTRLLEHLEGGGDAPTDWQNLQMPLTPMPALRLPRAQLHERIMRRIHLMFENGLVEEVHALRREYPEWSETAEQAIGYAEVCALIDGKLSRTEAIERIAARTRQLAKRQETWFRHQIPTVWIDIDKRDPPEQIAPRVREIWRLHGPVECTMR